MTRIEIINSGGTLDCDAISWNEKQVCDVAIRDIPRRADGPFIDTDTYVLRNRVINFTIRVTDDDLTTLQDIFDAAELAEITAYAVTAGHYWWYEGWIRKKPRKYEYSRDENGNIKEWLVDVECVVYDFVYEEE